MVVSSDCAALGSKFEPSWYLGRRMCTSDWWSFVSFSFETGFEETFLSYYVFFFLNII